MTVQDLTNIKRCDIFSHFDDLSVGVCGGISNFRYYESILENTISATLTITDTGYSIKSSKGFGTTGIIDGLDLRGGEKVSMIFVDNYGNELKFENDKSFRINRIRNIAENSNKMSFVIDMCSSELLFNELEDRRVVKRYNGEISQSVSKILKDNLKTTKSLDLEKTRNHYNFIGEYRKPLDLCTLLAKYSVPESQDSFGKTAGYFFFETYDGFKFKSIENLFKSPKRYKKYIQNDTTGLPIGYDAKILKSNKSVNIDVINKMNIGAYGYRLKYYDPYSQVFTDTGGITSNSQNLLAGRNPYYIGSDLNGFTRIDYKSLDSGNMPTGITAEERVSKANVENLDTKNIIAQSTSRYNQLFTIKVDILIYGDFSLRAGEIIHCDFPESSSKGNQDYSAKSSGLYMIADVCHLISPLGPSNGLTSLTLIRDSDGRKPFNIQL